MGAFVHLERPTMSERTTTLPPASVEIRATGEARGSPFLGGVSRQSVFFYLAKAHRCHEIELHDLIRAAARAGQCTPLQVIRDLLQDLVHPPAEDCLPGFGVPDAEATLAELARDLGLPTLTLSGPSGPDLTESAHDGVSDGGAGQPAA
jgi:hypothetical protein